MITYKKQATHMHVIEYCLLASFKRGPDISITNCITQILDKCAIAAI